MYLCLQKRKLVKWFIAPLFGKEQWPPSNSHALTIYPNNCVYQRGPIHFLLFTPSLLFFGTHSEKLHNPLQESCPHGPFYDLDPTPVAHWRGATLLWWGPSLWSARPFVRGLWLLGRVRALWGAGAFVIHRKRKHQQVLNTAEHDTIKSNMGCKTAGDSDALIILFLEIGVSVIMRAVLTPSLRFQPSTSARN